MIYEICSPIPSRNGPPNKTGAKTERPRRVREREREKRENEREILPRQMRPHFERHPGHVPRKPRSRPWRHWCVNFPGRVPRNPPYVPPLRPRPFFFTTLSECCTLAELSIVTIGYALDRLITLDIGSEEIISRLALSLNPKQDKSKGSQREVKGKSK